MGALTESMTRLRDEILELRHNRQTLRTELERSTKAAAASSFRVSQVHCQRSGGSKVGLVRIRLRFRPGPQAITRRRTASPRRNITAKRAFRRRWRSRRRFTASRCSRSTGNTNGKY